jgi:hypothetical protein
MDAMMSWRDREHREPKEYDTIIWALDEKSLAHVEKIAHDRKYILADPPEGWDGRGAELDPGVRWQRTFTDRDRSEDELLALLDEGFQVDPDGPETQDAVDRARGRKEP